MQQQQGRLSALPMRGNPLFVKGGPPNYDPYWVRCGPLPKSNLYLPLCLLPQERGPEMLQRTFGRRVVTEPLPTESVVPDLTPESARALEDAATAQMNATVERVNAHIPGVSVIPWAIIPWSMWEGLNAELLISTDFLPSSPWNNLLLPADARSAEFLGLPEHPRTATPGLHENITPLIDQLRAERHAQVEACKIALSADGWSALERLEAHKAERFQNLFALARHVSVMVHGEAVCAHHDELFGIGLSEVTG